MRSDPEIGGVDRVARQLGRPAGQRHAALLEAVDAVGDRQRLHDVLLDEDDAGALRLDRRQRRVDVADDDRREAEADLVAEEQRADWPSARGRSRTSAAGRRKATSPAGRAAPRGSGRARRRASSVQRPRRAVAADQEILLDRQRGKQPPPFRHQRDAALTIRTARAPPIALAVEADAPRRARHEPGDGLQEGRFAGAVGADDGDRLAGSTSSVDAEQRLEVAVEGGRARASREAPSDASRLDAEIDFAHLGESITACGSPSAILRPKFEHDEPVDHGEQRMHDVLDPDDRDAALRGCRGWCPTSSSHSPSVSPPAISSSSRRRGSVASARASSSRLRSSSVSVPARRFGERQQAGALRGCRRSARRPRARALSRPCVAPTSRFSNTVRFSKGCGIWNDRPMPARRARCGGARGDVAAVEADACRSPAAARRRSG